VSAASLTRRAFVRAALAGAAAGLLPGCHRIERQPPPDIGFDYEAGRPLPWRNWAGNQGCLPAKRAAPESEEELLAFLSRSAGSVRPVGAGHSFSALVPSDGTLLASDFLSGLVSVDEERIQAEVWAGTRLHALGPLLQANDQASLNLPDIDYQTLGGAIATSTHGTGARFGSLSSTVVGLTLATPGGELLECSAERNAEVFHAARCSLGALGVVTRLRLQNQRPFRLAEQMRVESLEPLLEDIARRRNAHRHFEFHALPHTGLALAVSTDETDDTTSPSDAEAPEAVLALRELYERVGGLPGLGDWLYERQLVSAFGNQTAQRIGPSFQVLAHPRLVRFREMEYTVPAEAGPDCLREVLHTIRERRLPIVFPIEYRYVKADDVWLSMFHARDGCSISLHQYADEHSGGYFQTMEPIFAKYEGRPHWGKLHELDATRLARVHPRLRDFQEVREGLDPEGRLLNPHLERVLGAQRHT